MSIHKLLTFACILTGTLFLGCGPERPAGMPKIYPCTIEVTMNGEPQTEAVVHLMPDDGSKWYAGGTTGTDGKVKLATLAEYKGVAEGTYHVSILKPVDDPNWKPKKNFDGVLETEPGWTSLYDLTYANPATTPLTCTVVAGKNSFEFDMKENMLIKSSSKK
ncbi:MAG: hypothetical protein Q4G68_07720 [Planctomycetia bacterium]|nr:hypothetical protein [Planctomycetia bacterium]